MKRYALLLAALLMLTGYPALADCYNITVIDWQVTQWWDGTQTVLILGMTTYGYCDVSGGGPGDPAGGGPGGGPSCPTVLPSVSFASVDTTDPFNPMVAVDVTSNDPCYPVTTVVLEVNGVVADYAPYVGASRYLLHLSSIAGFPVGNVALNGKACSEVTGVCGQSSATMYRFTPSPDTASTIISASWQEAEVKGPITIFATFGHSLRQVYTTTTFSCGETGANSYVQIKDSLVTISGHGEIPMWTAGVQTSGTLNYASYGLSDSENPVGCTWPTVCETKAGNSAATFGYAPAVHETIFSFIAEGVRTTFTNGSLDISLP